ncbi:hypothetical protein QLQ15_13280 [Lysobacter sp. LF1]|uniref:Uncharacterized protein n=1 Tax=Lysobacter stagni TaxID=3045172 RepID=A0ABT6XI91_9GAMM|nr:hypothetical protein [Lysobacter sp. LF1]MDI9239878.1 hypothetical protein [Lysobacter sp. LF1]
MSIRTRADYIHRIYEHAYNTERLFIVEVFGDTLSEREGWNNELEGLEAVRFYLMQKHQWLPSHVRAMSADELMFAITEETASWTMPSEARDALALLPLPPGMRRKAGQPPRESGP